MKWNNRRERNKFIAEQAKLREQYIEAEMTDEQIQAMSEFDLTEFNGRRREAEHTFRLDEIDVDSVTVELELCSSSRYAWIDEIENQSIVKALKYMPQDYIEILTELIIDGLTHDEIAVRHGVVRTAITNKINRIKKIFEKIIDRRDN